jgi:FAD:protein FMN transferase
MYRTAPELNKTTLHDHLYQLVFRRLHILLIGAVMLSACGATPKQYDYSIFTFGTLVDITLYDVDKQLADEAFEQLQKDFDRYHLDWSPWTNGDLAQLNRQLSAGSPGEKTVINVPEHLLPIIKTSISLSEQSDNYFNPAIGQLINLWQFHRYQEEDIRPPDDALIQALLNKNPRMSDLSFNQHDQLLSSNPAVSLNFGAFAKGYAIALEIEKLKNLGIRNAVINAGGDLSVIGRHGT